MSHEIAVPTKCVHCNRMFYGPASEADPNKPPTPQYLQFMEKLYRHMIQAHPEAILKADAQAAEFKGILILGNFETQDKSLNLEKDRLRWRIHQATLLATSQNLDVRARQVADEFIDAKLDLITRAGADPQGNEDEVSIALHLKDGRALVLGPYTLAKIQPILEELRADLAIAIENVLDELVEVLEEPDKYPPPQPVEPQKEGPSLVL